MKRRTPGKTLIVGYGNPLRSDDGFGWQASQGLAGALVGREVEVITCHQLTPELADPLSQCALAIFLDADARGTPGQIHCRRIKPAPPSPEAFTHNCTPAQLLASAGTLYGSQPDGISITVSAESFDLGDQLSPSVSAALPKVTARVCRLVKQSSSRRPRRRKK
jgi:hydrogenase maturation protease